MNTKKCAKCEIEKIDTEFYLNRASKDGLTLRCKTCEKAASSKSRNKTRSTARGKALHAWQNLNWRCEKHRSYIDKIMVKMTKEEFLEWAVPEYDKFMRFCPNEQPSLDRVNTYGHYEIGNIRIVPFSVNLRRAKRKSVPNVLDIGGLAEKVKRLCQTHEIQLDELIERLKEKVAVR